jgi:cysteine desulfurase/selenocysteine lyase
MDGAAGFTVALDYLESVGLDFIYRYEKLLLAYTMDKVGDLPGLHVYGVAPEKGGILSFLIDGIHAHDLAAFLDTRGIAIRAGHHCAHPLARRLGVGSTARASF